MVVRREKCAVKGNQVTLSGSFNRFRKGHEKGPGFGYRVIYANRISCAVARKLFLELLLANEGRRFFTYLS